MITISEKEFQPQLSDWYQGRGTYKGTATLSVSGVELAKGEVEVLWNDLGETSISMNLPPEHFQLAYSLLDAAEISIRAEVDNGGSFVADRVFVVNIPINSADVSTRIQLSAARSTFQTASLEAPTYWMIPAINFVADLHFSNSELAKHPLRIYPAPDIPEGLTPDEAIVARMIATQKERLIPFFFDGKPAFIEKLPDYDAKVISLKERRAERHATAVIVGAIPSNASTDLISLLNWLPSDILYALSVCTGTYVGSGFVELRSSNNNLFRRVHISSGGPAYKKGHCFVEDPFCAQGRSAYAEFIECVMTAFPTRQYLRSVANQLVAGLQHHMVEDATASYVRALEALTKAASFSQQNLLAGVPAPVATNVLTTLGSAASAINTEAIAAKVNGDATTFDRLSRIANRTRSASQTENQFGLAVTMLAAARGLKDEEVVNKYLANKIPETTWAQFLSKTRGAVIHEGMIHLPTRNALLEVHAMLRHLGDVVLRLLAIEIGYTGSYLPTVARWARDPREILWVNSATTPTDLRLQ